jgi:hypothetical protein
VPNYVVAPVHIQHDDLRRFRRSFEEAERGASVGGGDNIPVSRNLQMLLEAFDQKFHLNLKKVNHLFGGASAGKGTRVFYADMVDGKPVLMDAGPEMSLTSLQEALYQDIDNMAALSIRTSKDQDDNLMLVRWHVIHVENGIYMPIIL